VKKPAEIKLRVKRTVPQTWFSKCLRRPAFAYSHRSPEDAAREAAAQVLGVGASSIAIIWDAANGGHLNVGDEATCTARFREEVAL
jgi:hypothetical protein